MKHKWIKTKGLYTAYCEKCEMKRMDHKPINGLKIAPSYSTPEKCWTTAHEPLCNPLVQSNI